MIFNLTITFSVGCHWKPTKKKADVVIIVGRVILGQAKALWTFVASFL